MSALPYVPLFMVVTGVH